MMINTERSIEEIEKLRPYLPEKNKEELEQILAYGEEMKAEGERKKQEFWKDHVRDDFMKLLRYKWKNKKEIEGKYQYLGTMKGLERERFIKEYLHDDMLYSGELDKTEAEERTYSYENWKEGNVVIKEGVTLELNGNYIGAEGAEAIAKNMKLKEGMTLNLGQNQIGDEGAKAISHIELKEGVKLYLSNNQIGDEGVKVIAENMELKEGVYLSFWLNNIGNEGANAISANLRLKEGVFLNLEANKIGDVGAKALSRIELKEGMTLNLSYNEIGDEGVLAIMEKMELKEGVTLNLLDNQISEKMKDNLIKWNEERIKKGINCKVKV